MDERAYLPGELQPARLAAAFFPLPSGSQLICPVSSFGYGKGVVSVSYSLAQTLIRLLSEVFHNSREGCAV